MTEISAPLHPWQLSDSPWHGFYARFRKNKAACVSFTFLFLLVGLAFFASILAPYSFEEQDVSATLQPPSFEHWMGTDRLGRDLFSRTLFGTRVSMTVGIVTALSALIIGSLYGAVSGYIGGRTDQIMMRGVDVVYALPDLLLIILLNMVIGRGILGILIALSLVSWVTVARLVRGEVLRLREQTYVEAAVALGANHTWILLRHLLPNTLGLLIVTVTFRIPAAILAESTLSFIGIGIAPPDASWGTLANEGWAAMRFSPHLILFPSSIIFTTILAFNFLGDGLRDAFDPSMDRSQ
ncbi:MAG TPA: ABC transporter permease [Nitrospiria bacterium]